MSEPYLHQKLEKIVASQVETRPERLRPPPLLPTLLPPLLPIASFRPPTFCLPTFCLPTIFLPPTPSITPSVPCRAGEKVAGGLVSHPRLRLLLWCPRPVGHARCGHRLPRLARAVLLGPRGHHLQTPRPTPWQRPTCASGAGEPCSPPPPTLTVHAVCVCVQMPVDAISDDTTCTCTCTSLMTAHAHAHAHL